MDGRQRITLWLFVLLMLASTVALFAQPPFKQDPNYHDFADQRSRFGIPNFDDVASNLPFLIVGVWALNALKRRDSRIAFTDHREQRAYLVTFAGLTLDVLRLQLLPLASRQPTPSLGPHALHSALYGLALGHARGACFAEGWLVFAAPVHPGRPGQCHLLDLDGVPQCGGPATLLPCPIRLCCRNYSYARDVSIQLHAHPMGSRRGNYVCHSKSGGGVGPPNLFLR